METPEDVPCQLPYHMPEPVPISRQVGRPSFRGAKAFWMRPGDGYKPCIIVLTDTCCMSSLECSLLSAGSAYAGLSVLYVLPCSSAVLCSSVIAGDCEVEDMMRSLMLLMVPVPPVLPLLYRRSA